MTVTEIREDLRKKLAGFGQIMTTKQKMQVALNLDITVHTVDRYLTDKTELVNLDLAESIFNECLKITQTATA